MECSICCAHLKALRDALLRRVHGEALDRLRVGRGADGHHLDVAAGAGLRNETGEVVQRDAVPQTR